MNAQLPLFPLPTSSATPNATSSPALEDGHSRSNSQELAQTPHSGQVPAPASHSPTQANGEAPTMSATSGPSGLDSLTSANLQLCLESRLQANLEGLGSPEYAHKWKRWDMQSGPPICALRASPRRKSASVYGGWATPDAGVMNDGSNVEDHLRRLARLKAKHGNGNGAGMPLGVQSKLAGWPTVTCRDHKDGTAKSCANVHHNNLLGRVCHGVIPDGMSAETASAEGFRLNPAFTLWLMGYPTAWHSCGVQAMQSFPKSRRNSSKRRSKPSKK